MKQKELHVRLTVEQHAQLKEIAGDKNISNFVRDIIEFYIKTLYPIEEDLYTDLPRVKLADMPHGCLAILADRLGVKRKIVYRWRQTGVPSAIADVVKKEAEQIVEEYWQSKNVAYRCRIGILPSGGISAIADYLGKPYNTVRHWNKYGIPMAHRESVKKAKRKLGYD